MLKYVFAALLIFACAHSFADDEDPREEAKLQKVYGMDLNVVPFFLKYRYWKYNGKQWSDTYYVERRVFLAHYDKESADEKKKEKEEARQALAMEKERLRKKKEDERRKRDFWREQAQMQKQEELEEKQRQKAFDDMVKDENREINIMRETLSHTRDQE